MGAGELADLAREAHAAVGEEDFRLADAAGIKEDIAGCGKARVVLERQAEIELAERDPAGFSAPPHMDDALAAGQQARELGAALWRRGRFEPCQEDEAPGGDTDRGQRRLPLLRRCVGHPTPYRRSCRRPDWHSFRICP